MSDTSTTARPDTGSPKAPKKVERERDIELALERYRAETKATDEKTARLRAARLARESAAREAALAAKASAPVKKSARKRAAG